MSIETEIMSVQEEENVPSDSSPKENPYKIFDYFNDHTGLLVTSISALVAIMSFILRFAVGRMNYAYLAYWDIASLHANISNQNELYLALGTLLYICALLIIQTLISRTAYAFKYYNCLLLGINRVMRKSRKTHRRLTKKIRSLCRDWKKLPNKEKKSKQGQKIKERVDKDYELAKEWTQSLKNLKKSRNRLSARVTIQIIVALVLSYLLGSLFLVLLNVSTPIRESFRLSRVVVVHIITNLLLYFVPAYYGACRQIKQYKDDEIHDKVLELSSSDAPGFPFENLMKEGIKPLFTDNKLKLAIVPIAFVMAFLVFILSFAGTLSAEQKRCFPIYSDNSAVYAIVYFSGSTVFMEEAVVQEGTITIDTTKQRIVTKDDLSYSNKVFEDVVIIRNEGELAASDNNTLKIKDIFRTAGAFFESIKTIIEETIVKNEENISGTECRSTVGS